MIQAEQCKSCGTVRRAIRGRGMCGKCYYWQCKVEECQARLEYLEDHPSKCRSGSVTILLSRIAQAKRIVEELRWREDCLHSETASVEDLESLMFAIARDGRSGISPKTDQLLSSAPPKARRSVFEALLPILENLPCRLPSLHERPYLVSGGYYSHGWPNWYRQYNSSRAFSEGVFRGRRLEAKGREIREKEARKKSQHSNRILASTRKRKER